VGTDIVLLIGGLVLIGVAADQAVVGAARLADRFRLPRVVVGALLIGVGTSMPELFVDTLAVLEGRPTLALGELMGSNAANIGLVLGSAALVMARPLVVDSGVLAREVPLSLGACLVFVVVVLAGSPRLAGLALLVGAVVVVRTIVTRPRTAPVAEPGDVELSREVGVLVGRVSVPREWVRALAGLAVTLVAAQGVLTGAVSLAERFGLAEGFVGLAIIAVGTSLPELVTALTGVRRGEDELVIGNVLGSNLTNSLLVGGIVVLLAGEPAATPTLRAAGLLVTSLVLLLAMAMGRGLHVSRVEGALLLLTWGAGLALVATV
jgi:cation:H+ antiporter